MSFKKKLYLGKSINDLDKKIEIDEAQFKNRKILQNIETARKLYIESELAYRTGDEERSYILLNKYFALMNIIKKHQQYSLHKKEIFKILGTNEKQMKAMDTLERIINSLKERYRIEYEIKEGNNIVREGSPIATSYPIETKSMSQMTLSDKKNQKPYITCAELYEKMIDKSIGLLLLDCRPSNDFMDSRLHYPFCINVAEHYIAKGISAGRIQSKLTSEEKKMWSARGFKDHVILIDWNTKSDEPARVNTLFSLLGILQNWDPDAEYKSLLFLKGGYEEFILKYPTLCTNPNVNAPTIANGDVYDNVDEIEYPSFDDITMKDETFFDKENQKPQINRNTKPAAVKMYEYKDTTINKIIKELLEREQQLANKTLQIEQQRYQVEETIKDTIIESEKASDEQTKNKGIQKATELEYSIMQLENDKLDIIEERILTEEQFKAVEEETVKQNETQEVLKPEDIQFVNSKRLHIAETVSKANQVHELSEILASQTRLAIPRQNKRKFDESSQDENFKRLDIPKFDRSSKPTIILSDLNKYYLNIQRDFSPVYGGQIPGVTGLKNLGNTCYMNSIIQCISNTYSLNESFIKGGFRKHLNTSSKTRGRIVEEVAAVVCALWVGKYKSISCTDLRYYIGQFESSFRGYQQQDSHEFLTILMDWLHLDLQTIDIKEPTGNISSSEKAWIEFTKLKESLISQLSYGQIKSTVKCMKCTKESATFESFSNLSLELPATSSRFQISDCLDLYFNGEKITGWNCPNCKQKRDAIKKLDISRLPPILIIHFKRFYANTDLISTFRKKQNYIHFPVCNMDMTPYVARSEIRASKNRQSRTYNLYAVSNHYGSMESGHYTAFCKNSVRDCWYKFDDQTVTSINTNDVESSAAYILFYTSLPTDANIYK